MQATSTSEEIHAAKQVDRKAAKLGKSASVQRFLNKYGPVKTRIAYLSQLVLYFRWLKDVKGILLDPDALIQDNLQHVYGSLDVDVKRKRTHTDWIDEYVNVYMRNEGYAEATRLLAAAAVCRFYQRNDSRLFGDFSVARDSEGKRDPPALQASDIRVVLNALPLSTRLPLLLVWQTSFEINAVLRLTWGDVAGINDEGVRILKLERRGRKNHRNSFHSYAGMDAINHLRLWCEVWTEQLGRRPERTDLIHRGPTGPLSYRTIEGKFKLTAMRLVKAGLIRNSDPDAWTTHKLRHSFRTEGEHSGVETWVLEFFLGHNNGIESRYSHADETHEDDLIQRYLKIEPYVSLSPSELVLKESFSRKEKELREEFESRLTTLEAEMRSFLEKRPSS